MVKIRLDQNNSKVFGDRVYITPVKANTVNADLLGNSKIVHPVLGTLIEYRGPYTRRVK